MFATKYNRCILYIFFLLITTSSGLSANVTSYKMDPVHSTVWFRVLHLAISPAYGAFSEISGENTI